MKGKDFIAKTTNINNQIEISINKPNKETIAAMLEAENIAKNPSIKGYNDLDELFTDLKNK